MGGAALLGAAGLFNPASAESLYEIKLTDELGRYTLADLPYAPDALEPHIDAQTMQLHHGRHHQGYVNGINNALDKLAEARESGDYSLVKHWSRENQLSWRRSLPAYPFLEWSCHPTAAASPQTRPCANTSTAASAPSKKFRAHFLAASNAVEGSGWGVLAWEPVGQRLIIHQVERQSDLSTWSNIPLLMVDVWEHAYYLRYQNRRGEYTQAFMNVVDWDEVARRLDAALRFG